MLGHKQLPYARTVRFYLERITRSVCEFLSQIFTFMIARCMLYSVC